MRKTVKKLLIVLAASCTLVICLTGCFNKQDNPKEVELGERYDSDKILVSEDGRTVGIERFAELFDQYSKYTSEIKFAVHEETAIAIAEAVMRELYPDDYYGVVRLPRYFRPLYYKTENCWEVWLHKNGLSNLSYREQIQAEVMLVYIDVNTGAVKAIIPADEFSVHNPANSESGEQIPPENSEITADSTQTAVTTAVYDFTQGNDGASFSAEVSLNGQYQYTLTIKKENDEKLLSLSGNASSLNEVVDFLDYNLDGYLDVRVLEQEGTMNNSYALFIWDESTGNFDRAICDEMLSDIEVRDGYLINWVSVDAQSQMMQKFVWDGNTLVKISEEICESEVTG